MNNSYFLEIAYAKILGSRLERFKVKKESPFLASARCPICGDSAKNKTKTRFAIYSKNNELNVGCFNCGLSTTFISFLKVNYKQLFDEFLFEKFKNNAPIKKKEFVPTPLKYEVATKEPDILDLVLVSDLPDDHFAKQYIKERNLPAYPFYYTDKFYEYSSQYNDIFKSNKRDEARIIIPFFDRRGKIFAYQGRDLSGHAKQKYITVKINEKTPLLFGLKTINVHQEIQLVEGPIDSLMLPNALASVNASLCSTALWLIKGLKLPKEQIVVIHDNEPRSKSICSEYEKTISAGFKTVIWPTNCHYKDINDIVMHNEDPIKVITNNTYSGLLAQLQFTKYCKVTY